MDDQPMLYDSSSGDQQLLCSIEQDDDRATSEVSSVLSDPPSDLDWDDDTTAKSRPGSRNPKSIFKKRYQERAPSPFTEPDENEDDDSDVFYYDSEDMSIKDGQSSPDVEEAEALKKLSLDDFYTLKIDSAVSKFEKVPYEVLQRIATLLPSDSDLASLIRTCHTFARQLMPENSGVWKTRFLRKYDHPIVEGPYEFRIAYQLRAVILPWFCDLGFEKRKNAELLLDVLKDMVLETYNKSLSWHESPKTSLNISGFSDAMKSNWMVHFLSTPLFGRDEASVYGHSHKLFDTLQVTFAYLVLNRSAMAFQVGRDKLDYDLEKVYNYDQSHALLYTRLPELEQEPMRPPNPLFPNLRREAPSPKIQFDLNMNTLLHIRNFWHRHLTESKTMGGEETYSAMAASLMKLGITPKGWSKPLQESSKLATRWYGHYSCIYPWPKTSKSLHEKESEAEVWDVIDPLSLDFSPTADLKTAWPPIFSSIPSFSKTLSHLLTSPKHGTVTPIRGLAPFTSIASIHHPVPQHTLSPQTHHPYTRLRLRGLIHALEPQAAIPGFQRAVFVLYKPTHRFLCDVFDHATECFGDPFQQQLNSILGADASHEELEEQYVAYLTTELGNLKGPVGMDRRLVERIEDAYCDPRDLRWDDIEFAYAYEGVLMPGGGVMMGRWWRVGPPGPNGRGEGQEYGTGVGYERGPFVFWPV